MEGNTVARSSTSICPVPLEQQPLNEYKEMREAWLFHWVTLARGRYILRLTVVWGLAWLAIGPVVAGTFAPAKDLGHFLLGTAEGCAVVVVLLLLRLYSGWRYVRERLNSDTVEYEESGWYDGQRWEKPEQVLVQERLVASYQVQPALDRLRQTFLTIAGICGAGGLLWSVI